MNAAHWDELELLFEQAQALPPEERTAFLDAACRGDAALRDELDSLLRFSDNATHYFEALAGTVKSAAALVDQNQPRMGKDAMVGRKVAHYQVLTRLGGGGMGVVYKAWDLKLDRFVALKFLTPSLSADRDAKRRFIQEARAASALDHPNVAAIYDFNETAEGQLFIVMPFYAGETLKQKAARGAQPPAEVLAYAVQVARGLAKTHEAGIIHRDVKCANVLVTPQGEAKILDFGLAKLADQQLTKTGAAMGTIAYMAPEQARGEPIDPRADLWSLGVVLYELLTGKLPFRRAHEQGTLYAILNEQPQPLAALQGDIPLQLERIVARCLQKDPARRYPDAAALLADLERAREALAGGVRARRPFAPWQRWTCVVPGANGSARTACQPSSCLPCCLSTT
jgi:serine/threonine protein kinase